MLWVADDADPDVIRPFPVRMTLGSNLVVVEANAVSMSLETVDRLPCMDSLHVLLSRRLHMSLRVYLAFLFVYYIYLTYVSMQ